MEGESEGAMKVSKQQGNENRERILAVASRLFREQGIAGVGVDALSEAASLSHGSVYSQFGSKDRLAAEALQAGYAKAETRSADVGTVQEFLTQVPVRPSIATTVAPAASWRHWVATCPASPPMSAAPSRAS